MSARKRHDEYLHVRGKRNVQGAMSRAQLHRIAAMAKMMEKVIHDEDELPAWLASHITSAHETLSQVFSYVEPRSHHTGRR
jgi:hypothetical protein